MMSRILWPGVACLLILVCLANAQMDTAIDCQIRLIAAQYAIYLQPDTARAPQASANWSKVVYDGLQMDSLCPTTVSLTGYHIQPIVTPKQQKCDWSVYVDGTNGNDTNPGTITQPLQTIQHALRLSRSRTASVSPCIIVRTGVYYLGFDDSKNSRPSQVGAIDLTSVDSNLTISAYKGEDVTFSAGRLLQPKWQLYTNTSAGPIYFTQLPDDLLLDWGHFNELYIDNNRAIRAKYPNGDPSTHGLYSDDSGFIQTADSWLPPKDYSTATKIYVSEPNRSPSYFPDYQIGIGGVAQVYDPPHSFWASANPPGEY